MKKLLFVLIAIVLLMSCEDTKTNQVAMQAEVDNEFYTSTEVRAVVNVDGSVTIQGLNQFESMTLNIARLGQGSYTIEEGSRNYAVYNDLGGNAYTTIPNGEGVVTISDLNETNKTLSGTFKFNAFLANIDTVYVSKGVLYNISYGDGNITDPTHAGLFSADVNGNPFVPVTVTSQNTGSSILTTATTADAIILISVPSTVDPGVFTIPRARFSAKYQGADGPEATTEGVVEILEHDVAAKTLKGTFSFITDTTNITEGVFDVVYQ